MTFLPVVERELRAAARRRHTYWSRFAGALAGVVFGAWIWGWLAAAQPEHARGLTLFRVISTLAFVYCIAAGIGITSDCLSEEKREGTLGLLFLTDLKGYDVVLGKLAATSINALYRLFSVFPILAIPLLLGGLTPAEVGRMALVLTNTLLFSLSAGIFVSALSLRDRRAMIGTFLLICAVSAGPPLIGLLLHLRDKTLAFDQRWLWSSPVYSSLLVLDKPYQLQPSAYWSSIAVTHSCAWAFLAACSFVVRRVWQDRPAGATTGGWRRHWRNWQFGFGARKNGLRQRLLEINPMLWRSGRDRFKQVLVFAALALAGVIWGILALKYRRIMFDPTIYFISAYAVHTALKVWIACEACRPFAEDRRSGALELILSTPLSVDEILEGEILALQRQFCGPAVLVLVFDLAIINAGMHDRVLDSSNDWFFVCAGMMVMFVVDMFTLAWTGLWLGLTSRKGTWAVTGTVLRVLVLPWAVFFFALGLAAIGQWRGLDELSELGLLTGGFAIAMFFDAWFYNWAKSNLRLRFRQIATERFQTRRPEDKDISLESRGSANFAVSTRA